MSCAYSIGKGTRERNYTLQFPAPRSPASAVRSRRRQGVWPGRCRRIRPARSATAHPPAGQGSKATGLCQRRPSSAGNRRQRPRAGSGAPAAMGRATSAWEWFPSVAHGGTSSWRTGPMNGVQYSETMSRVTAKEKQTLRKEPASRIWIMYSSFLATVFMSWSRGWGLAAHRQHQCLTLCLRCGPTQTP